MHTRETRADGQTREDGAPYFTPPIADQGPVRLGHYVLLDRLGAGGMGVVYAAYDDQLARKVAIKLLRSAGGEQARARLVREAHALAKLSHPNVVQIYEIAEVEFLGAKRTCLVMEFVDGDTLKAWHSVRHRSRQEILEVFIAAGRGLAAVHAVRLVHRDFKPENVMIRGDGRVLVMDFGLAFTDHPSVSNDTLSGGDPQAAPGDGSDAEHLTVAGGLTGTPAYMAPEQFLGREADAKTDQFAFCVALWEALFGRRPFKGDDVRALSLAVTSGEISRPDHDDVPGWLRVLLERGLEVDPARRFDSMDELLDALGRDPTRRRRLALGFGSLAAVAVISVAGLAWNSRHAHATAIAACDADSRAIEADWNDELEAELALRFRASDLEIAGAAWDSTSWWLDAYAREWSRIRAEACVATTVDRVRSADSHQQTIDCLDERRATFAGLTQAWGELDAAAVVRAPLAAANLPPLAACSDESALAHRLRPPPESREGVAVLRARIDRAEALQLAGKSGLAFDEAESVLADAEAIGWRPVVAEARTMVGELHDDLGRPDDAVVELRKAALEAVAGGDDMLTLHVSVLLCAIVGSKLAHHEEGLMWGQLGASLIERLSLGGTLHEAHVISAMAGVQDDVGQLDDALAAEVRALSIREAALGPGHPEIAISLDALGTVVADRGDFAQALEHFERARQIREDTLGPDHLEIAYSLNSIAGVQMQQGELDAALATLERSQTIISSILGTQHLELAPSYNNIGLIHWQRGRYDEALRAFDRAQQIQAELLGPEHPRVAAAIDNIGNVLVSQGRYEEAEASLRRALAMREKSLGPDHADVGSSLNNLGTVLIERGGDAEAMSCFARARTILERELGPDHPFVASAVVNIADIHLRRSEVEPALELYPVALAAFELTLGPDSSYAAFPLVGIGRARLAKGQLEEAKLALERALEIRIKNPGTPAESADVRFPLAQVLWELGRRKEARELGLSARRGYRDAGAASIDELAQVERWLAQHE